MGMSTSKLHIFMGFLSEVGGASLGKEDPLEKEMATHSSILAWRIPWTEEPGELQFMGGKESNTTEWQTYTFVVLLYFYKIFIKIQVDNVKVLGESEYTDNDIMPVAISSVQFSR